MYTWSRADLTVVTTSPAAAAVLGGTVGGVQASGWMHGSSKFTIRT